MTAHLDILDQEDSLRQPFMGSLFLHLGILVAIGAAVFFQPDPFLFGEKDAQGGGSVVITPVSSINMPSPTQRVQPLANDTDSTIPERLEVPKPVDPDAIGLDKKKKKEEPKPKKENTFLSDYLKSRREAMDRQPDPSNIGSSTGARASAAMFTTQPGAGGVGTPSGMLGDGFGAYEQYLRTCIARNWKTDDIDSGVRTAPEVIVQFQILRDGSPRAIRVIQTSSNGRLDNSGLRAVEGCSPFNPLPPGFPKSSADIQIVFKLQR